MSADVPQHPRTKSLLSRLSPWSWLRRRREQALMCTLPWVLQYAARRSTEEHRDAVELTGADYALIQARVRAQHDAQGLRYVAPFCSWKALLEFAASGAVKGPVVFARPGSNEKVAAMLNATADGRLSLHLEAAAAVDWSLDGTVCRWERVEAVRRS